MPAKYQDYPVYTYDEPAIYKDFSGGINTDPSNEHLHDNEMRDCVNMHYSSGALVKRKGAKLLCNISCEDELFNVQGVFLFTYRITYIIIAADGKLYKGFYNDAATIKLERLHINIEKPNDILLYDPLDHTVGLPEQYSENVNTNHEGFILSFAYILNAEGKKEKIFYNYLGDYYEVTSQPVLASRHDVISLNNQKYLCIKDTTFDFITPTSEEYDLVEQDGVIVKVPKYYWVVNDTQAINADEWNQNKTDYVIDSLVKYNNVIYKCIVSHTIRKLDLQDDKYFIKIYDNKELIFQNYRNIEAATFDNKLYIPTGTRFIEVKLVDNVLIASPVQPYMVGSGEYTSIGPNYLSPYPEMARVTMFDQTITSIVSILVNKTILGRYLLEPQMTFAPGESHTDYYYKWEKQIDGTWFTIYSFKDNVITEERALEDGTTETVTFKRDLSIIDVDDADTALYRVTFAKSFKTTTDMSTLVTTYDEEEIYKFNQVTKETSYDHDWILDGADGEYFGSSTTVLFDRNLSINDKYKIIQSCTKIHSDGNKFLLYDDRFNSGSWFKTVIGNPGYTTDRGSLSFKTTKNEALVKVVAFAGNIVVFANSANTGGSIHLVVGNGDDFEDDYYSPYRRQTINSSISCDNPNTVQIAENYLIFKHFDTVYILEASELNSENVSLYSANDKIKAKSPEVEIPWTDNNCISEITEDYYALMWKEKYILEDGELILDHPAIRVKMYYKLGKNYGGKVYFPWLRDESEAFNIDHIIYIKGKPIYLYQNTLTSMHEPVYTDFGAVYQHKVHPKGVDLNYPKMYKLLSNVLVDYHRNQYSKIDFEIQVKNEAGHLLLDSTSKRVSLQDLRALKTGDRIYDDDKLRVDSTILDSKVFNTTYKFPCLIADTTITGETEKEFSISSITYNYTTIETPDTTPYDLYASILRKKGV